MSNPIHPKALEVREKLWAQKIWTRQDEADLRIISDAIYEAVENTELLDRLTHDRMEFKDRAEKAEKRFRILCNDISDDLGCVPGCNSYRHETDCPLNNPAQAFRLLRERLEAAKARTLKLERALRRIEASDTHYISVTDLARAALKGYS